jgi:hypothetical protein
MEHPVVGVAVQDQAVISLPAISVDGRAFEHIALNEALTVPLSSF